MIQPIVNIDAQILKGFRRRAILAAKDKKEYIEAIFIVGDRGNFVVKEIHKMKIIKANLYVVETDDEYTKVLVELCESKGYKFATIHTHIGYEAPSAPSTQDIVGSKQFDEPLIGILDISAPIEGRRTTTKLTFWLPVYPCKTEIINEE